MSLPLFLQGLGSVGVFASRAFLPAFVTALLLRFGPQVSWLAHSGLIPRLRGVPTWFTSDLSVVVLGVLAAIELIAERVPEAKSVLDEIHGFLKAGMATLTYLGVLDAADRAAVGPKIREAGLLEAPAALLVGAGTYLVSKVREATLGPLLRADEDDDLGLQRLLRWAGDLWAGLGSAALIVLPLLTVAVSGLAALLLVLIERVVESRAERTKVPCPHCGRPIHAGAPTCPKCRATAREPRGVGLLGQATGRPADLATLPYQLAAAKRCPICATRLGRRVARQDCPACGHSLMADPGFVEGYVRFLDRRVPFACAVGLALGLIPVLGVIPGVIYYRLAIVAPYRRYIPPGRGFLLRWGIRLAVAILVAFQWIPVAGALALPSMALVSYAAYRTAFRRLAPGD